MQTKNPDIIHLILPGMPSYIYYALHLTNDVNYIVSLNIEFPRLYKTPPITDIFKYFVTCLNQISTGWYLSIINDSRLTIQHIDIKRNDINKFMNLLYNTTADDLTQAYNNTLYTGLKDLPQNIIKKKVIFDFTGMAINAGFADRLRGILELYDIALLLDTKFYINCIHPFTLDKYLLPNKYDWRPRPGDISYNPQLSILIAAPVGGYENFFGGKSGLRNYVISYICNSEKKQFRIFTNNITDQCTPKYHSYFQHLFKFSPLLENALMCHKKILGDKYISASFRFMNILGDFPDAVQRDILAPEKQICVMQQCAAQLNNLINELPPYYKIFVASDSGKFINFIKSMPRVYAIPSIRIPSWLDNCDEQTTLLMMCDFFIITAAEKIYRFQAINTGMYSTGFPYIASLIGAKPFIHRNFKVDWNKYQ